MSSRPRGEGFEALSVSTCNLATYCPFQSNESVRSSLHENVGQPQIEQCVECGEAQQAVIPPLLRRAQKAGDKNDGDQTGAGLPEALRQNNRQRIGAPQELTGREPASSVPRPSMRLA